MTHAKHLSRGFSRGKDDWKACCNSFQIKFIILNLWWQSILLHCSSSSVLWDETSDVGGQNKRTKKTFFHFLFGVWTVKRLRVCILKKDFNDDKNFSACFLCHPPPPFLHALLILPFWFQFSHVYRPRLEKKHKILTWAGCGCCWGERGRVKHGEKMPKP